MRGCILFATISADLFISKLVIHPFTFLPFEMEIFLSFGYLECASVQVFEFRNDIQYFARTVEFFTKWSNENYVLQEF